MSMITRRRLLGGTLATGFMDTWLFANAFAATSTVRAVGVKYDPMIVEIEPGDSVSFESMASHNVETLSPLCPDGFEKINTTIGENVSLTFDTEGVYVYKCTPHWGSRMGGVIVVGPPDNVKTVAEEYLATVESEKGDLLPAKGLLKDLVSKYS